jgi:tripartite-type tricarboxylate transporter receptor subunit TctC
VAALTSSRRALLLAAPTLALSGRVAHAQGSTWPERPVRVILPWPPGGTADIVGRLFFNALSQETGKPFVIENRPGATGTIGAATFAQAAPDGYTLLHGSTGLSVEGALFNNLPYDAGKDFIPVFRTITVPQLVLVPARLPIRTPAEIVAYAKENRGINGASAGIGSIQHLAMELFARQTGAPVTHVPYRGGALIYTDLMTGTVDLYFGNANAPVGFVKEGKLRALAHTGRGRLTALPDVPPLSDLLPGFETYEWNGVFLPKDTSPAVVARLNALLNDALDRPDVAEKLRSQDLQAERNTPDEFAAFFAAQSRRWQGFLREAGIRLE